MGGVDGDDCRAAPHESRWGIEALCPNELSAVLPAPKEVRGVASNPNSASMPASSALVDAKRDASLIGLPCLPGVSLADRRRASASESPIDFSSTWESKAFNCADSSTTRLSGVPLTPPHKAVRTTIMVFATLANKDRASILLTMRPPCVMLRPIDRVDIVEYQFPAGRPVSDRRSVKSSDGSEIGRSSVPPFTRIGAATVKTRSDPCDRKRPWVRDQCAELRPRIFLLLSFA
jgi:hypothetical protein